MSKKRFQMLLAVIALGVFLMPGLASAKKKPGKPKFVGALKCDGSCHDPWYRAWSQTQLGKAYTNLKPGVKAEQKKSVGLDPDKDYTKDPACLRCHTTGYKQKGGFNPKKHANEDPTEPNLAAVGCEMCHTIMGGAAGRIVMKNKKEKFTRKEIEKVGWRYDMENVCKRCHGHEHNPFKGKPFNYEEMKKKVHPVEKYRSADNKDQIVTKKDGVSVHKLNGDGVTEANPLPIETWEIVDGKFKKRGKWAKWDKKGKKVIWVDK